MPHDTPLISTIVGALVLAFILGAVAQRMRISPLIGYLLAGVAVGPFTPGFVADQHLALQLAEIGVILLMFGVGLHFSLKDLLSVRAIAIPGAIAQIGVATLLGMALAWAMGWSLGGGIVFGLSLSVASTVVLLRALQERRLIESEKGRIAVGWLIVEDLAMVLALVLLPAVAEALGGTASRAGAASHFLGDAGIMTTLLVTLGKVAAFVILMLVVGRKVIPWAMHWVAHTGSRELFRLAVLAIALGVAYGSAVLFGVSFALGAFFAGMVLSESPLSHRAAEETLPLRDAFAVLFFVSVGMLVDPHIVIQHPLPLLAAVAIVLVGKSIAAYGLVRMFGHERMTALTISASLAQIGEFSFILAALGLDLGLLPTEGRDLILAAAIISILANPFFFIALDRYGARVAAKVEAGKPKEAAPTVRQIPITEKTGHTVLVGYGRVGRIVCEGLTAAGVPLVVIEDASDAVEALRSSGVEVIDANAALHEALLAAKLKEARRLILAIPDGFEAGSVLKKARAINPELEIIARAHSDAEVDHLRSNGAGFIIMGEREVARGMLAHVLTDTPEPSSDPTPDGLEESLFDRPNGAMEAALKGPEDEAPADEAPTSARRDEAPTPEVADGPATEAVEPAATAPDGAAAGGARPAHG